jgi:hypothetical protein
VETVLEDEGDETMLLLRLYVRIGKKREKGKKGKREKGKGKREKGKGKKVIGKRKKGKGKREKGNGKYQHYKQTMSALHGLLA